MLNSTQVKELFEKEAILIGSEDAVPLYRVRALFGDHAAGFVDGKYDRKWFNLFGVGDFQLPYVTFAGFRYAASFSNVEEVRDTVGESASWDICETVKDSLIPEYIFADIEALRSKYPGHTGWGIISEVLEKAAATEKKRQQRKGAAV